MADSKKFIDGLHQEKLTDVGDGLHAEAKTILVKQADDSYLELSINDLKQLPTGGATEAKQDVINTTLGTLLTLVGFDAKADIAVSALRDAILGTDSKTLSDLATALTILNGKDFATQATLAAILTQLGTTGLKKIIDSLPAGSNLIGKVDVNSSALPTGAATENTLAGIKNALTAGGLPSGTLETTHHNAATTNGNGTAANVAGYGPMAFQAVGTWDCATVTYKGSVDGTNYAALPGTSAVTTDGIFQCDVSGYKSVIAEISSAGATTSLTVKSLAVSVAKPTSADVVAVGKDADNAAVTGNPLLIAGRYSATPATRHNGDVAALETDAQGRLLTTVSGSIPTGTNVIGKAQGSVKVVVDTIVNAQSIAGSGGSLGSTSLGITDETELWLAINIDQQPWSVSAGRPFLPLSTNTYSIYPIRYNATTVYNNSHTPCLSLVLGIPPHTDNGLTAPSSITEAKNYIALTNGMVLNAFNNAASVATITIKAIRIWR